MEMSMDELKAEVVALRDRCIDLESQNSTLRRGFKEACEDAKKLQDQKEAAVGILKMMIKLIN